MRVRTTIISLLALAAAGASSAGTLSDTYYRLYYLGPGGDVRVLSSEPLPPGSNVAPNNQWRYDYEVINKSPNALNAYYAFFNSDNVDRAHFVSGTAPASWTVLQQGPVSPNFNFKVRYRTTVTAAKIPAGGTLLCSGTFTWTGTATPGSQNYDAVNDGGSESGGTVERVDITPATPSTWGRLKTLYGD